MGSLNELLTLAQSQVGYQEKQSAVMLDDFRANAGYGNYTRYARDVDQWGLAGCQGQPWCATYQFWLEAQNFGVEQALRHFHMTRSSYCGYNCFDIYEAFARVGKTSGKPEVGSLVVFRHSHIGRVIRVSGGRVYTNEGNTSALYGDSNGGTVKNKDYTIGDGNIRGYCRMDYSQKEDGETVPQQPNPESVKKVRVETFQSWLNTWYPQVLQKYCGGLLQEDGLYGNKTRNAALAVWKDVVNRLYGGTLNLQNTVFNRDCRKAAEKVLIREGEDGTLPVIIQGILGESGDVVSGLIRG